MRRVGTSEKSEAQNTTEPLRTHTSEMPAEPRAGLGRSVILFSVFAIVGLVSLTLHDRLILGRMADRPPRPVGREAVSRYSPVMSLVWEPRKPFAQRLLEYRQPVVLTDTIASEWAVLSSPAHSWTRAYLTAEVAEFKRVYSSTPNTSSATGLFLYSDSEREMVQIAGFPWHR
jgi:hypothetical protein